MRKEKIIEMLKKLKEKQGKLNLKKNEKRRKEIELRNKKKELNINITSKYIEGGKSNNIGSIVENAVINKNEKIQELESEIKELEEDIEELELDIEEINIRLGVLSYLEKEVITAYYVDNLSYEYIGNNTYYEIRHQTRSGDAIKKLVKRILEKMEKL